MTGSGQGQAAEKCSPKLSLIRDVNSHPSTFLSRQRSASLSSVEQAFADGEIALLYFDEANKIWRSFVPKSGQADTVQGELLRAVEKLRDEATRNGNGNWDDGFEILILYLESHLLDTAVFGQQLIAKTSSELRRLRDFADPYLGDDLYDAITDRVVEYFRFYGSQPHAKNPNLRR